MYAGTAMTRRATYMYGTLLDRGPRGQVGCGPGQNTSTGEIAIIVPTIDITTTGETHTIDGVQIEFQMAPAPRRPPKCTSTSRSSGPCAWPRTPPTTCTTC